VELPRGYGRSLGNAAAAGETLRSLDPTSFAGYYQIGHAAIRRRRAAEALSNLRRAHELNPNDSRTLQFLGWAEFNVGLAKAAGEHAELALRVSPRDPQRYLSYWVLAFAALITDEPLEGAEWARKAIDENVNFIGGYGILAACLAEAGTDAARTAIDFVPNHQPEYIRSRLAGNNYFGLPELGERYTRALRAAAGEMLKGDLTSTVTGQRHLAAILAANVVDFLVRCAPIRTVPQGAARVLSRLDLVPGRSSEHDVPP